MKIKPKPARYAQPPGTKLVPRRERRTPRPYIDLEAHDAAVAAGEIVQPPRRAGSQPAEPVDHPLADQPAEPWASLQEAPPASPILANPPADETPPPPPADPADLAEEFPGAMSRPAPIDAIPGNLIPPKTRSRARRQP